MSCDTKKVAAEGALRLLESELKSREGLVGVGTGSTVREFVELAAESLRGRRVVSSSLSTAMELSSRGLDVILYPASKTVIDFYVDGADEITPNGDMIKGGGGALLGEKILAYSSRLNVFIVGEEKLSELLGTRSPVPIEVVPEAYPYVASSLEALGFRYSVRQGKGKVGPIISDWRGVLVDVYTGPMKEPAGVEEKLRSIPGVVETGIFIGFADYVVIGRRSCSYEILRLRRTAKAPYL